MNTPERNIVVLFEDADHIISMATRWFKKIPEVEVITCIDMKEVEILFRSGINPHTVLAWVVDGNLEDNVYTNADGIAIIESILALDSEAKILDFSSSGSLTKHHIKLANG